MLARSITLLGFCCLALCACNKPKASQTSKCSADGGCPDASVCPDGAVCDAEDRAESGGEAKASAADGGTQGKRVQASRRAPSAGESPDAGEAAAPAMSSKPSASGQAGSGGKARKSEPAAGGSAEKKAPSQPAAGGQPASEKPSECDEACKKDCEKSCGPCQACGADNKTCEPVMGADDADSCSDTRSCSSKGTCLNVSEAHKERGNTVEWTKLTASYAQVITFSKPASIEEIRLEVSCEEGEQTFPAVWLVSAPGGVPSNNTIATANVLFQAPTEKNFFARLELSKVLEEPEAGPIAIVIGKTDMNCIFRLNTEKPYPNGNLFIQGSIETWIPSDGSMVFEVLSSK